MLSKPDKLNGREWGEIKRHPVIGCGMVEQLKLFKAEEPLVRHHHERYDGKGYPTGLKGDGIPLGVRILAIADAYDAMTSPRPYRQAFDPAATRKIIRDGQGTQFDPKLSEVFLNII